MAIKSVIKWERFKIIHQKLHEQARKELDDQQVFSKYWRERFPKMYENMMKKRRNKWRNKK